MTNRTTAILWGALALAGCGAKTGPDTETEGGTSDTLSTSSTTTDTTSSGTTSTTATATLTCPAFAFDGSDNCQEPSCCSGGGGVDLAAHCYSGTEGAQPVPYLCSGNPPNNGTGTDGRACVEISLAAVTCSGWAAATRLLCCEVAK